MELNIVDLSAVVGLAATLVLTLNYLFGMLIATGYRRSVYWKKLPHSVRRVSVYRWHNRTAYVALLLAVVHPLLLLLDRATKFRFIDLLFPLEAPTQKWFVALGTVALYAFVVVVFTSQKRIKKRLSFRAWKNIHLISYAAAVLFIFHGILIDPELKNRAVDVFDGEKLISVGCLIVLIAATSWRVRYHRRNRPLQPV